MTGAVATTLTSTSPDPDAIALKSVSTPPLKDAVVTVMKGAVGAHVGLLYRVDDKGTLRHLHLARHYRLKNDLAPPMDALWVEPRLEELELADVRASARLIAKRQEDGRVPYAFRPGDARFDTAGTLQLGQSRGLTCATFVMLVFAHASVTLVEVTTWEQDRSEVRRSQDEIAQSVLVEYLRSQSDSREHAELVVGEVGCTRVRAEEVAAASGMSGHPISFARAEPQGHHVLEVIRIS